MLLEIKKEDAEEIGRYLANRPWNEVNGLILMLLNLKPVNKVAEVKNAPKDK